MLSRASSPALARAKPRPPVEVAWGSQSMRRVGRPSRAMAAAKLMAVVVLPTPPFWLTTAMTLDGVAADGGAAVWGLLRGRIVIIGVKKGYREAGLVAMRLGLSRSAPAWENFWNSPFPTEILRFSPGHIAQIFI